MPVDVLLRSEKGTQLSAAEVDQNFTDLQDSVNIARNETSTETSVTLTAGNKRIILADASAGSMVITLPPAANVLDEIYYIKKVDGSVNTVTVDGDTTDTIDGSLTNVITTQYAGIEIVSDGADWFVLGTF